MLSESNPFLHPMLSACPLPSTTPGAQFVRLSSVNCVSWATSSSDRHKIMPITIAVCKGFSEAGNCQPLSLRTCLSLRTQRGSHLFSSKWPLLDSQAVPAAVPRPFVPTRARRARLCPRDQFPSRRPLSTFRQPTKCQIERCWKRVAANHQPTLSATMRTFESRVESSRAATAPFSVSWASSANFSP